MDQDYWQQRCRDVDFVTGWILRMLRQQRGFELEEFAAQIGVNPERLWHIEGGRQSLTAAPILAAGDLSGFGGYKLLLPAAEPKALVKKAGNQELRAALERLTSRA